MADQFLPCSTSPAHKRKRERLWMKREKSSSTKCNKTLSKKFFKSITNSYLTGWMVPVIDHKNVQLRSHDNMKTIFPPEAPNTSKHEIWLGFSQNECATLAENLMSRISLIFEYPTGRNISCTDNKLIINIKSRNQKGFISMGTLTTVAFILKMCCHISKISTKFCR